jgi:hypothetical protein
MGISDIFQLYISTDGKEWTHPPGEVSDNYFWIARRARERSQMLKRYERIVRPDMTDTVIITFKDGAALARS